MPGPVAHFHRASIARARRFRAVRGRSCRLDRVPGRTQPFTPVPLTSTDNAEADGSIPSSPTKVQVRRCVLTSAVQRMASTDCAEVGTRRRARPGCPLSGMRVSTSSFHRDVAEEGRPDRAETLRFDLGSVGCFCALLQAARERNGRSGDGLERPTYPAFRASGDADYFGG